MEASIPSVPMRYKPTLNDANPTHVGTSQPMRSDTAPEIGPTSALAQGDNAEDETGETWIEPSSVLEIERRHEFVDANRHKADEQADKVHHEMPIAEDAKRHQRLFDRTLVTDEPERAV